jgi:signal transduction histidine kinase
MTAAATATPRRWQANWGAMAAYVAAYLALDWISLIDAYSHAAITPWNPPAGLSFAVLLRYGLGFLPAVFLAVAVAEVLFHGLSASPVATGLAALAIAASYGTAAAILGRLAGFSPRLDGNRDLLWLLAVAIGMTMLLAPAVAAVFAWRGLLGWSEFTAAATRFWVGDVIGVAVLTPFLLVLFDRPFPLAPPDARTLAEYALQAAAIGAGLWIIFGFEDTDHFEYSYALFLPLIWIALRDGMIGATWGVVATQLGLILAIQWKGYGADVVTQFQLLMLAVAATGLFLGQVVDQRRRAELRLKQHEAELARDARRRTTGELAAALAHEINQPLTALIAFARACQTVLRGPDAGGEAARGAASELIDRTVQQATRAGEIVRATREAFGHGDLRPVKSDIYAVIDAVLDMARGEAARHGARISVQLENPLPAVLVDPIQIEQVLLNFLNNSMDAMARAGAANRQIVIAAAPAAEPGFVELSVRDNGPGIPAEIADRLFTPFATTKESGMGLGLAISRSIVEAHGGRIRVGAARSGRGAEVRFTVPAYSEAADA